jgi:phosphopantetheinyl transferase (holo-ACP synthase)
MSNDRDVVPAGAEGQPALAVWLAGPAARARFDASSQTAADLARWREIATTRRREEWEVSRALLAHVRGEMGSRAALDLSASSSTRRDEQQSVAAAGDAITLPLAGSEHRSMPQQAPASLAHEDTALSLSHSGGFAAVAASRAAVRVGVDLECERPRDLSRLARFAFSEDEHSQLEALADDAARAERFYILWTLKEAFAKALSLPLLTSLRQCTFLQTHGVWRGTVPTASAWVAHTFRASPALVLSVVAVLPESVSPEDFSVFTHEWPEPTAQSWRTLATLRFISA